MAKVVEKGKTGANSGTSILRYTEKKAEAPISRETPVKKPETEVKNKIGKEEFNLTAEEAKKELGKLFDENEVKFLFRDDLGKGVLGQYKPGNVDIYTGVAKPMIQLLEKNGKVSNSTLFHESFHAYLSNFVSEAERASVLKKVQDNYLSKISQQFYRKNYKGAAARAEEWLADDFAKYVKNGTGQFSSLYQKIIEKVRGWIRKSTGAQKIYDDILAKKRPNGMIQSKGVGEVKYKMGETSLDKEAPKYKSAEEFVKAQTDPLFEFKKIGTVKDGLGAGTVKDAINDIGGIDNVRRGSVDVNKLETTENINTNSTRYKAVESEVKKGNITPIIADEYLQIMDGHHRLEVYKAMGMKDIPVIVPKDTVDVKFQTKSQLTDIWNKAKGISPKDQMTINIEELIAETEKIKKGKIDLEGMDMLNEIKDKLTANKKITPEETRLYNVLAEGAGRPDLKI